ncbi:MAG: hypothetical protein N2688_15515 [Burkholderiaceae bacterium]|nr:hypothetical protein [Burkholderiaceae bacterium]
MASTEIETVSPAADKAKLAAAALLAVLGFVAYYLLGARGAWAQWGALLVAGLAGAALLGRPS